jgi:diguanylate cyclase (GGDEF)-like protein
MLEPLNLIPPGLVLAGVALLIASLLPACRLCGEARDTVKGWRGLAVLIVGFILGYIAYNVSLIGRDLSAIDFVVAGVFFLGSIFVLVVSRLSMITIREVRRMTALERHRASHDGLTGLPNRCAFSDRIGHLIRQDMDRVGKGRFSVLIMDLDRFKAINDTLGHDYGDRLLLAVSARLEEVVQENHVLARLGGDEFGIVIEGLSGERRILAIAERIRTALHEPFAIDGHVMDAGVSVGAAFYPEHGTDATTLMKRAEIAMYAAKNLPTHGAVYAEALEQHSLNHLSLLGELRRAIDADELELVFHPQLDLAKGAITGLEALVRWPGHQGGRMVLPDEFVPLAEQTGMIVQLDRWVIGQVARYLRAWDHGRFELTISTNISARSLSDPAFLDYVTETFRADDISPRSLVLEITESAVMADPEQAMHAVTRLTRMGFGFSIDDFGTGYSSLAYLKRLPASEIKIDKSFVTDMSFDENDAVIVRSTIDLAHNMGRRVVAEGVEDKDTLDLLAILGCDQVQGYYISKPLHWSDLGDWLRTGPFNPRQTDMLASMA